MEKIRKYQTFFILLLLVAVSFFSWRYLLSPGYFPMHDDMQAMRVLQLHKCLIDGQIPCRWVPDMGYGYGYPQFNYYSPLPYYIMEGFHLLGFSILGSVKIGFILSFVLSALAMFLLGRSLWGNFGGFTSAVFYTYAPYRAMDVYNRGAVGEFWALVFFPLIFWAIYQFLKSDKRVYLLWLALSFGGLLLSHNISSMIFLPFIAGWTLILLFVLKKWSLLPKLFFSGFWGIGLAAFFILPAILEQKFAHTETMLMGYFNYLAHFISWRQIFFSTHWGYSSSILGPGDDVSFSVGIFHWLFALLALIIIFKKRRGEKLLFLIALFLFFGAIATTFMTHLRSVFIWNNFSFLAYLQFPWRFLVLSTFLFSVLVGGILKFIPSKKNSLIISSILVFLVILFNFGFFRPARWYDITDKEKFAGELWKKQLTISIFDYLPIFAQMPPGEKAPEEPIFIEGEGEVKNYKKGTDWQKGEIQVFRQSTVRLPIFYFPGWEVSIDGQKSNFVYDNFLGLITFDLTEGEHEIFAKLKDTPVRKTGNTLSLLGLIAVPVFLFWNKKGRKK